MTINAIVATLLAAQPYLASPIPTPQPAPTPQVYLEPALHTTYDPAALLPRGRPSKAS